MAEKNAFREIAKGLGARLDPEFDALTGQDPGPQNPPANGCAVPAPAATTKDAMAPVSLAETAKAGLPRPAPPCWIICPWAC